jgi:hypothetical protein
MRAAGQHHEQGLIIVIFSCFAAGGIIGSSEPKGSTMRNLASLVSGLAVSAFIALPALAQPEVCLQLNRIYNTHVVDSRTLFATDLQHRPYFIHMTSRCVGLNQAAQNLSFRRAGEIGSEYLCLQHGDILGYSLPGDPSMGLRSITPHGVQTQMQCTVDAVTPAPPPPP